MPDIQVDEHQVRLRGLIVDVLAVVERQGWDNEIARARFPGLRAVDEVFLREGLIDRPFHIGVVSRQRSRIRWRCPGIAARSDLEGKIVRDRAVHRDQEDHIVVETSSSVIGEPEHTGLVVADSDLSQRSVHVVCDPEFVQAAAVRLDVVGAVRPVEGCAVQVVLPPGIVGDFEEDMTRRRKGSGFGRADAGVIWQLPCRCWRHLVLGRFGRRRFGQGGALFTGTLGRLPRNPGNRFGCVRRQVGAPQRHRRHGDDREDQEQDGYPTLPWAVVNTFIPCHNIFLSKQGFSKKPLRNRHSGCPRRHSRSLRMCKILTVQYKTVAKSDQFNQIRLTFFSNY
ncbi:hypothetical protein DSECCO2_449590 [anaerobic digester metagenome]